VSGGEPDLVAPFDERALTGHWLPALGSPAQRLDHGGAIADVGCGRGAAAVVLARRYPLATVHGFDPDPPSVDAARAAAAAAGVGSRCTFTVARADDVPVGRYDLLCFLGGLHLIADPLAAARRARKVVADDGVVLVVGPTATGAALAARDSRARVMAILREARFTVVDQVAMTPLRYIVAARPGR
jgi:ubiquinone/menaquinone biosynthesis C-methylase UbiE